MTCSVPRNQFRPNNGASRWGLASPFHFKIPRDTFGAAFEGRHDHAHPSSTFGRTLPPSIHKLLADIQPPSEALCCRSECRVRYTVQAELMMNHRSSPKGRQTALREVRLLPALPAQPPLCTSDFKGEYVLSARSELKKPFMGLRLGGGPAVGELMLRVVEEPPPLRLLSGKRALVSTPITINAQYKQFNPIAGGSGGLDESLRSSLRGRITTTVKAMTFVSVQPRDRAPTNQDAIVSPYTNKKSKSYSSQRHGVAFPPWSLRKAEAIGKISMRCPTLC